MGNETATTRPTKRRHIFRKKNNHTNDLLLLPFSLLFRHHHRQIFLWIDIQTLYRVCVKMLIFDVKQKICGLFLFSTPVVIYSIHGFSSNDFFFLDYHKVSVHINQWRRQVTFIDLYDLTYSFPRQTRTNNTQNTNRPGTLPARGGSQVGLSLM